MLKKTITYDDYNDNTVTDDFFFNFTKLELMEKELQLGGLETTIKRLTETNNNEEAYHLFKHLIMASYGKKSEDGKRFIKSKELTESFEQSPALSELIIEFLQKPELGAAFIEGTLPAKLVAEVNAAKEKEKSTAQNVELPTAAPELETTSAEYELKEPTQKELTAMSHEELLEHMQRKNQGA